MDEHAKWLQIIVSTDADNSEVISEHLEAIGALSVTFLDAGDEALFEIEPHSQSQWQQTKVVGLFENQQNANQLAKEFKSLCGEPTPKFDIEWLEDEAWERRCLEDFQPMLFGNNLWITPSWHETPPKPNARVVQLDPGLAFGAGSHPTTALCLEWIDSADFDNKRAIDYGCGSGILAIAAIKCGASKVDAVDHDEQALLATKHNCLNNQCAHQVSTYLPEAYEPNSADIILANILAGPLVKLAPTLASLCNSDGSLILSGLLAEQRELIEKAYETWFSIRSFRERDGWLLLECVKH